MFLSFELKNILRTPLVIILSILLFIFTLFAVYNGKSRTNKQLETIKIIKEKEHKFYTAKKTMLDSIEKNTKKPFPDDKWFLSPQYPLTLGAVRGAGTYAILTPSPLSVVSTGQSDIFPFYTKIALDNNNAGDDNDNFENPFNIAQGEFDLAFVFVFILPLLVIVFGYNLLSVEREQGTLLLIKSMPIRINVWLLNKIIFRFLFLLLICVVFLCFSFVLFDISIQNFDFLQMIISTSFYLLFWFLLCFLVNLLGKSSTTNATFLVGSWVFFVLLVPSIANILATNLYPVPSRTEFVTAQRDIQNEVEKQREKIVDEFYAKNPTFKKPKQEEKKWRDYWREGFVEKDFGQKKLNALQESFMKKTEAQRNFADNFQYFSPAILFQNALNSIAKTDTKTYLAFQKKVNDFEKKWSFYFKSKFDKDEKMKVKDFDNFPKF